MRVKLILFLLLFFESCHYDNEEYLIEYYSSNMSNFEDIANYINLNVIPKFDVVHFNNILITRGEKAHIVTNRICDITLSERFNIYNINRVTITKTHCNNKIKFGLIMFLMDIPNNFNNYHYYYYYYDLCNSNQYSTDKKSFKNIPLGNNWSIAIEKD
ncbi:MAG: hypothetical protein MUE81_13455 [Thermoflexibacter sp.]|nr:hypothetical protein [Thermoflexibacter sp.]